MANKKVRAKKITPKPKRKIGRYVLLLMLFAGAAYPLREVVLVRSLPDFDFQSWAGERSYQEIEISIQGDLNYLDKVVLEEGLAKNISDSFMNVSLESMSREMMANPWIKYASIKRVWPSTLMLNLEEEQPIARWSNNGFVNRYGEVVEVEQDGRLEHLPVLHGDSGNAYAITQEYLLMSKLLNDRDLYISSLSARDTEGWIIEVNNLFKINLGSREIDDRLNRFIYLYDSQLYEINERVKYVDLRYPNGVAVEWLDSGREVENQINSKIVSGYGNG